MQQQAEQQRASSPSSSNNGGLEESEETFQTNDRETNNEESFVSGTGVLSTGGASVRGSGTTRGRGRGRGGKGEVMTRKKRDELLVCLVSSLDVT